MKAALLQLDMTVGDVRGNADAILQAAIRAHGLGARLAVSSELAVCGYPSRDLLFDASFIRACRRELSRVAAALPDGMTLLAGGPEANRTGAGNPLFNAAFVLSEGRVANCFGKRLLPSYDVFDERRYFEPSMSRNILELDGWRVGVTVCEDVWNDQASGPSRLYEYNPLEMLAAADVDVVVNLSSSPFTLGKQARREGMLSAMAAKYGVHFLYCNQVGGNDDLVFDGRSLAVRPDGHIFARGGAFAEDLVLVDMEKNVGAVAEDDFEPCSEAWRALVMGSGDYVRKCGFSSGLLGLSGGVDSALTAAVAVEALGPDNVLGVLMPSPFTSRESLEDAAALAANLGIRTLTIPIQPLMEAFDASLAGAFAGRDRDVTEENIQARIRGNLLMAMSNKYGSMLLTTGNKSELAVGYCTIYGDMSGGLAVISDVPKTLVFDLCRWLNRDGEVIPERIITKPPSAELAPDQRDQDSLPPYDVLDAILKEHVERYKSVDELAAMGFDREVAAKVVRLVSVAEFKRRQAAPGIKISDRAFGTGWRMPVAAKRDW